VTEKVSVHDFILFAASRRRGINAAPVSGDRKCTHIKLFSQKL